MMKKGLFALWPASLALAFLLGYQLSPAPQSQTSGQQPTFAQSRVQSNTATQLAGNNEQSVSTALVVKQTASPSAPAPAEVKDSLVQIKSLLGDGNMLMDMEGIAQSYLLVQTFSEQDVLESLSLLKNELEQANNMMPLMLILGRYAELNPQQAIAFTEDNISSSQTKMAAMASVIGAWSKQDPQGAYNWYLNSQENNPNQGAFSANSAGLMAIFNGLANQDLDDAISKLADISGHKNNTMMAVSGITSAFTDKEQFAHFLEQTKALDDRRIQSSVLSTWTMKNPQDTVAWLDNIENEEDKKALQQEVLGSWMFTQPLAAASWYISQADEQDKQSASEQIISQWGRNDPSATLNWLEQQVDIDNETSAKILLETSVYEHPDFVIEHLERLSDDKDKQQLSFNIYQALERESEQKAANFLASSPYRESLENQIDEYQQRQANGQ
ncbi:hypothetical protein [Thalassomonas sp. RHCl1]|uniref:hypothetical protein n=1 Tax=Thalassomonas sp. RHCl1 TaxID=2995320 RepID=UPI00248C798F|nr:hypothetical protein [Thalassomonas sp. RHCl1]